MEIKEVLRLHKMWLANEEGGERANLIGANLRYANLSGADFSDAELSGADLRYADLSGANFGGANLELAIFAEGWVITKQVQS